MNIIIVNDYATVQGGAAQVAVTSAQGLADAGHMVTYVFAAGDAASALIHPHITLVNFKQYDLLSNPSKIDAARVGIWNKSVEEQMAQLLHQFNPNNTIIHIHSWVKALSVSVFSPIQEQHFSTVLTLHDYFTVCPNGGLYNYQTESICQLTPMSASCLISNCDTRSYTQKLWRYLRQSFYKKASFPNQIENFISVSKFSENILKPYLPKNATFWSIPNPIDILPLEKSHPEASNVFSFIGRLSTEKGAKLFAKANKHLDIKSRYVGSGELFDELQTINPNAEFTGWCDRAEVTQHIQDSRAIVFPSLLYETQGMVVLEAAALGVPAIVSDLSAASEYIVDGETGLLFKSGDINSLVEKIKILDDNPKLAKQLGENAYNKYWKHPNHMQTHTDFLIVCYSTILKAERATLKP
ncbi:MAG: glycosyltransferase [Bacteroidales bacterium]|nr:glycosyltransferase [Bacteroidales bacterium]